VPATGTLRQWAHLERICGVARRVCCVTGASEIEAGVVRYKAAEGRSSANATTPRGGNAERGTVAIAIGNDDPGPASDGSGPP
jgi:hypothetical protein